MRLFVAALLVTACATPAPQPEMTPSVTCHPEVAGSGTPGIVEMDAIIDETGRVIDICPVRGERDFFDAAEKALRQWRFKPATLDGKLVAFRFHFTTRFSGS